MQPVLRPVATIVAASVFVAAATGQAQRHAVEVARHGQTFANGDTLTAFVSARVNDLGQWAAHVETESATGTLGERVLFLGDTVIRTGQTAPGAPNQTITDILDFDLDDTGRLTLAVEGTSGFLLYYGNSLVLHENDPATAAGFGPSSRFLGISHVDANASRQLLLRCYVLDGTHSTLVSHCLVRLDLGPGGTIQSQHLLTRADEIPAGQSSPIRSLSSFDRGVSFNDDARGTWGAELDPGALPGEYVTYQNAGTLLHQSEAPSPVNGRDWSIREVYCSASNLLGSTAFPARLDSSNTSDDEVIVKDGAIRWREDDPYTGLPGSPTIWGIGTSLVSLTDDGDVVFLVTIDRGGSLASYVVRDNEVVLGAGDTLYGGGVIHGVYDFEAGFHASGDGRFVIVQAFIEGQDFALVYVQRELGVPYCAAQTNSTGQRAITTARGVSLLSSDRFELVTDQAPPGSFGYYITSRTQGDVLFPGGSSGRICLGGAIGRFVSQVGQVDPAGRFRREPDLSNFPTTPNVAVAPGDTWNFQMWFRDAGPTGATSNFSLPIAVEFH